jgi:D-3-phosphoglycerate dehydrogenase
LTELSIGIIGYGNTGQAVAKKLSGFGCRIMYYDKLEIDFPNNPAERVEKEILLKKADIISIHIPLDDQNKGLINREFIESVSKPFYFLNLSRGEIMIVEDILAGLNSGKIKAAAFDVWDNENPDLWNDAEIQRFEQFVKTNRVVFTPHIAGWTFASYKKISEVLLRKIEFECSYFKN